MQKRRLKSSIFETGTKLLIGNETGLSGEDDRESQGQTLIGLWASHMINGLLDRHSFHFLQLQRFLWKLRRSQRPSLWWVGTLLLFSPLFPLLCNQIPLVFERNECYVSMADIAPKESPGRKRKRVERAANLNYFTYGMHSPMLKKLTSSCNLDSTCLFVVIRHSKVEPNQDVGVCLFLSFLFLTNCVC